MAALGAANAEVVSTVERRVSTGVDGDFVRPSAHWLLAVTCAALLAFLVVLFRIEAISIEGLHPFSLVFQCLVPIGVVAGYCHWRGHNKLREGCLLVGWGCLLVGILQWPQYAAARARLPFQDAFLMKADHLLGVNVGGVVHWMQAHPALDLVSQRCYGLLFFLVGLAMVLPPLRGEIRRSQTFLLSTILACVLGCLLFSIFPAIGPWSSEGFSPYANQQLYAHQLTALRGTQPFIANLEYSCGLITFPSFHVALAALSVFALWPVWWLRIPATLTAVLVSIATVTTGWHYAVDGIAGLVLSVFSAVFGELLVRWWTTKSQFRCVSTS